eukprot:IDg21822t1
MLVLDNLSSATYTALHKCACAYYDVSLVASDRFLGVYSSIAAYALVWYYAALYAMFLATCRSVCGFRVHGIGAPQRVTRAARHLVAARNALSAGSQRFGRGMRSK